VGLETVVHRELRVPKFDHNAAIALKIIILELNLIWQKNLNIAKFKGIPEHGNKLGIAFHGSLIIAHFASHSIGKAGINGNPW